MSSVFKDVEQLELSCTDGENINRHLLECGVAFLLKLKIRWKYDSAIPLPTIYPSELCTHKNQETKNVHNSIIQNNSNLKTNQMPINDRMEK